MLIPPSYLNRFAQNLFSSTINPQIKTINQSNVISIGFIDEVTLKCLMENGVLLTLTFQDGTWNLS